MPSTPSLIHKLQADYPELQFCETDTFACNASDSTVQFTTNHSHWQMLLLHELGHALLRHTDYSSDIELLKMERAAWTRATELASAYRVHMENEIIEQHLDSYRNWLHARSTCPSCQQTGIQASEKSYHCPLCTTTWRVNEARTCALRRYKTKHTP